MIAAFWTFVASCVGILWTNGGRDGRRLSIGIILATCATFLAGQVLGLEGAQSYVLSIDAILLGFAVGLALNSVSHWPIWFCGFHLIAVATGIARFAFPSDFPADYTNSAGFWALPALGSAALGAWMDGRTVVVEPQLGC